MKTTLLALFGVLILSISFYPSNFFTPMEPTIQVKSVLQKIIDDDKSPSVQYVIFDEDNILYKFQNGWADIINKRTVNDHTTYNGYSVTKTFTALAVLQLAETGAVNIDDPVIRHLPNFPYDNEITIRNLLTHSSGIPNPIPLSWIHLTTEHEEIDKKAFIDSVIAENPKTKSHPNEKYTYSNIGYLILGQLIEEVSGQTYEEYIKVNILSKLEGDNLDFTIRNTENHAKGYQKRWSFTNMILGFFLDKSHYMDEPEGKWKPFKPFYVNGPAYGGLIGNPDGFVAYIQELMMENSSLINDEYKQLLFTKNVLSNGKSSGMCLSWFAGEMEGTKYYSHAGGGGGYYVEIRLYPELGLGSVIMFNRSGMSDERFLDKVDRYFIKSNKQAYQ